MAKNPFPSFNFYPDDWLASKARAFMTLEEQGAYLNLLCHAWTSDPPCTLPMDEAHLAALSGLGSKWKESAEKLLGWFVPKAGRLVNTKLYHVYTKALTFRALKSEAGRKSGETRRKTAEQNLNRTRTEHEPPTPTPTPTPFLKSSTLLEKTEEQKIMAASPILVSPQEAPKETPIAPLEIQEAWNEICVPLGLPKVREIKGKRRENVMRRLREHPTLDFWDDVFKGIKQSAFLQGKVNGYEKGHKTWKVTLDWLFENDGNAVKVTEGNYDH